MRWVDLRKRLELRQKTNTGWGWYTLDDGGFVSLSSHRDHRGLFCATFGAKVSVSGVCALEVSGKGVLRGSLGDAVV